MPIPSHSGLYKVVCKNYGEQTMKLCRYHIATALRIVKQKQHIAFNNRCRRYWLRPFSLRVKPLLNSVEGRWISERTSFQFLNARISENYRTLRKLQHQLRFQEEQLSDIMRSQDIVSLMTLRDSVQSRDIV